MLLDVGVSTTKITDDDYEDPNDPFMPYADENIDEISVDEYMEDDNNNELNINFNSDVSKIAINDILNEMRMGSPIKNDLLNDFLFDEATNFSQFGNSEHEGSAINPNDCYNNNFDENDAFKEHNTEGISNEGNLLDQLLNPESCSTPDVQVEFNDGVQFQYDASDQFTSEADITLSYPEEPINAAIAFPDNNDLGFEADITSNETDCLNGAEILNSNQYFPCSTNLPMTLKELQDDIEKYLNSEENFSYASFYEYANMIHNTSDGQGREKSDLTYNNEMLQEYISEQNQLFQNLDPINSVDSTSPPETAPLKECEIYSCKHCPFYTDNLHGLTVHMHVHADGHLNCTECSYSTTKTYNLRQHQAYEHGKGYCCQICDYVTHSSTKIKSHMRREH